MSINWQLIFVGLIVMGAVAYLVSRALRSWRAGKSGCGGSCGCTGKSENQTTRFVPVEEITMRK
jgi:hypothetical protein